MSEESIRVPSAGPSLFVTLALVVASVVFFLDYFGPATEQFKGGVYLTEQSAGLFLSLLCIVAALVVFLRFPARIYIDDGGVRMVRGVMGAAHSRIHKTTIDSLSVRVGNATHHQHRVMYCELWVDGSGGKKRLCRRPSAERAALEALAKRYAATWDAKFSPG